MTNDSSIGKRILDLLWHCISTYQQMSSGAPGPYLEAASELCELDIPDSLPRDSRFPDHVAQQSPTQLVTAMLFDAGNYLVEVGRYAESIPFLQRVIELSPDDADAHRELAVALSQNSQTEEALTQFHAYIGLRPTDPEGYCGAGDCLMALGRMQESIKAYRAARGVGPNHPAVVRRWAGLKKCGFQD